MKPVAAQDSQKGVDRGCAFRTALAEAASAEDSTAMAVTAAA